MVITDSNYIIHRKWIGDFLGSFDSFLIDYRDYDYVIRIRTITTSKCGYDHRITISMDCELAQFLSHFLLDGRLYNHVNSSEVIKSFDEYNNYLRL